MSKVTGVQPANLPCPFCAEAKQLRVVRIDYKDPDRDIVKCRRCRGQAMRIWWDGRVNTP